MATPAPPSGRDRQEGNTHRVDRQRPGSKAILDTCQNPPIRSQSDDWCGLTLGIKTAFRANERLAIQVEQVQYLGVGDTLTIKQRKNPEVSIRDLKGEWGRIDPEPS